MESNLSRSYNYNFHEKTLYQEKVREKITNLRQACQSNNRVGETPLNPPYFQFLSFKGFVLIPAESGQEDLKIPKSDLTSMRHEVQGGDAPIQVLLRSYTGYLVSGFKEQTASGRG
jgi:hypothetical protein